MPTRPKQDGQVDALLVYAQLLDQHRDPLAPPVRRFFDYHRGCSVFVRRATLLNRLAHQKRGGAR